MGHPTATAPSRDLPVSPEPGREAARDRTEYALAGARVILAAISLAAISLDATQPTRYVSLTYGLLAAYVAYSLILLTLARTRTTWSGQARIIIHACDVVVATVLTLFTEGPNSPFFVFFGFTLLAAGYRWGFWETVWTGVASGLLFASEAALLGFPGWNAGWVEGQFELNRFVIRCTHLALLAVMVGYLAEHEKIARAKARESASLDERGRISRELHDSAIQSLVGLRTQIEILRLRQPGDSPLGSELARVEALLGNEVVSLRTLMFRLSPVDQSAVELSGVLSDLIDRFQRASGMSVRFVSTLENRRTSPRAVYEIGRIVQEALVNVQKHSGGSSVLVSLSGEGGQVSLVVNDDGRGFDFRGRWSHEDLDDAHKGPRVIKERVRLLGGSLTIDSTPGVGSQLEITLPSDA